MVKKNGAGAEMPDPAYSPSDVEEMEKLAIDKANKALSAIENAMAVWEAAKDKSPDLKERVDKLRYFYDALSNWERRMLLSQNERLEKKVELLREFTEIAYSYS